MTVFRSKEEMCKYASLQRITKAADNEEYHAASLGNHIIRYIRCSVLQMNKQIYKMSSSADE